MGSANRSMRSVLPEAMMCGTAIPQVNSEANSPPEAPAWCISSQTITESSASPPAPPADSPAFLCSSRGISPSRSQSSR
ncbi:Uncharacterised protein [Mycobacteroides abscessus subsp. abscessus]|nr:Uncharacterised protein [Mycobacteroides abscessus subsp. abscessus]